MLDGFTYRQKQTESFGLSTKDLQGDFLNKNKFPRYDSNLPLSLGAYNLNIQYEGQTLSTAVFGPSLGSGEKYTGMYLSPNGYIYGVPTEATTILKVDWRTNSYTQFGNVGGGLKWQYGVMAPDGRLYCSSTQVNSILVIDTNNDRYYTITNGVSSGYLHCAYFNKKIYWPPSIGGRTMVLDTVTERIYYIGPISIGDYRRNVTIYYEKIISASVTNDTPLQVINLKDETVNFVDIKGINDIYSGSILHPNGLIFYIQQGTQGSIALDPRNYEYQILTSRGSGTLRWVTGVLAADGYIYGVPYNNGFGANGILRIDPNRLTTSTFGTTQSADSGGGCLAPNGRIYCAPRAGLTTGIRVILSELPHNQQLDMNFLLSTNITV